MLRRDGLMVLGIVVSLQLLAALVVAFQDDGVMPEKMLVSEALSQRNTPTTL